MNEFTKGQIVGGLCAILGMVVSQIIMILLK